MNSDPIVKQKNIDLLLFLVNLDLTFLIGGKPNGHKFELCETFFLGFKTIFAKPIIANINNPIFAVLETFDLFDEIIF